MDLELTIARTREHLLSLRHPAGYWEGELSSSALATATALVALHQVNAVLHGEQISAGRAWLVQHQNADGAWGDTTISKSNLSTTLLVWSALRLTDGDAGCLRRAEQWITQCIGDLQPATIQRAVAGRYGRDKTFSVPILMLCAICGTLGEKGWSWVLPLPFELAALPREWFGVIGLPVVSYALPALIAIGHARHHHAPSWGPLRWLRKLVWERVRPMLHELQPASGGYLEATPLTSFVTMALASAGEVNHPCVEPAVSFLRASMRADGSWPIDTNLATWGTTLATKALGERDLPGVAEWLQAQQYREVHPFTNAAPGGWAWTNLSGGVPDADDTAGALIALHTLGADKPEEATQWLRDLQNRDGGMPTFCRGWGTLPFDRSSPELTAHALWAWHVWGEGGDSRERALRYLRREQSAEGSWVPLWFGNEHLPDDANPIYGTAQVLIALHHAAVSEPMVRHGLRYLAARQHADGSWGGSNANDSSIEETAVAMHALALHECDVEAVRRGAAWLCRATENGTTFAAKPIGLYFAKLWYHEQLYPVVWTLGALRAVR